MTIDDLIYVIGKKQVQIEFLQKELNLLKENIKKSYGGMADMASQFEEYAVDKTNGAILSGTKTAPTLSIKRYDSRSGSVRPNIVLNIETSDLNFWITQYQQKLNSLRLLQSDIQNLPD